MAISQTMSNPSDWILQYQTEFSDNNIITHTQITPKNTTADTTTSRNSNKLSPDIGRVSKPLRKRSRASRRTPTTLLNTDAANFRAMVQHFTGAPTPHQIIPNNINNYMDHPTRGFGVQYPNNSQLQQEQQQQHVFMVDSGLPPQGGPPPGTSSASENRNYDNYML